jgi:hypothetical protein
MAALPAVLVLKKLRMARLTVKIGANAELLTMPVPLMLKIGPTPPEMLKLYCGAPALNWIVLIDASSLMVTDVGRLPVKVAVPSGTVGVELQLVPVVHSLPGPVQVPSTACAAVTLAPIANNTARASARLISPAIMVAPPDVHAADHSASILLTRREHFPISHARDVNVSPISG